MYLRQFDDLVHQTLFACFGLLLPYISYLRQRYKKTSYLLIIELDLLLSLLKLKKRTMKKIFVIFGVALSLIACKPTNEPEVKTPMIIVKIHIHDCQNMDSVFTWSRELVIDANKKRTLYFNSDSIATDVLSLDTMKMYCPKFTLFYSIRDNQTSKGVGLGNESDTINTANISRDTIIHYDAFYYGL